MENSELLLDKLLKANGLTLSVAESCTGGRLASLFTAIPGCSHYFKGGVVSYSNEAKINILGVNAGDITHYGAVSQSVVEQMARGAQRMFGSDCAIATSGVAGPGGGTVDKPVGTVWIAAAYKDQLHSQVFHFSGNRAENISKACKTGIDMLLTII
ncbi:MAG: CinA family protein [Candidatus Symbiothrix sp.]|jgi:PncC family amidohydrolase|nr:CinA family protein [Candidatus Symbiothrix sp.]